MRNKCNEQFEMVVSTSPVVSTGSTTGLSVPELVEGTASEPVETTEGTAIRQLYKP